MDPRRLQALAEPDHAGRKPVRPHRRPHPSVMGPRPGSGSRAAGLTAIFPVFRKEDVTDAGREVSPRYGVCEREDPGTGCGKATQSSGSIGCPADAARVFDGYRGVDGGSGTTAHRSSPSGRYREARTYFRRGSSSVRSMPRRLAGGRLGTRHQSRPGVGGCLAREAIGGTARCSDPHRYLGGRRTPPVGARKDLDRRQRRTPEHPAPTDGDA